MNIPACPTTTASRPLPPWFAEARFGLFIHWGLYALPGKGEWALMNGDVAPDEYQALPDRFRPSSFDPAAWADLAWRAGMRYVVFTTKHHDGFCMFDSAHTEFKVTRTPYGKDVTALVVEAFRRRGFRIGLYHSLIDWTHPHYRPDRHHPLGKDGRTDFPGRDPAAYARYLYDSVEQLMTGYGKIDLLFWDYTTEWKSPLEWNPDPLLAMIRRHQPGIVINDRMSYDRTSYDGDYRTPECAVPNVPPHRGGLPLPWETCVTTNSSWGYNRDDHRFRSALAVASGLMACIARGGNLLVNVGPDERGAIPEGSARVLRDLETWFAHHEEAVRGTGPAAFRAPDGYVYTQKGGILYLYVPFPPMADILLPGLHGKIARAVLLRTGEGLRIRDDWGLEHCPPGETRLCPGPCCEGGDVVKLFLRP